jgi:transcriptional regulator with XRE-family HTH domain
MNDSTFGATIRARMNALNMPVAEVARRLDVTPIRVRQLLASARMREDTFARLCAAVYLRVHVVPIPIGERVVEWPSLAVAPWRSAESAPPPVAPPAKLPTP